MCSAAPSVTGQTLWSQQCLHPPLPAACPARGHCLGWTLVLVSRKIPRKLGGLQGRIQFSLWWSSSEWFLAHLVFFIATAEGRWEMNSNGCPWVAFWRPPGVCRKKRALLRLNSLPGFIFPRAAVKILHITQSCCSGPVLTKLPFQSLPEQSHFQLLLGDTSLFCSHHDSVCSLCHSHTSAEDLLKFTLKWVMMVLGDRTELNKMGLLFSPFQTKIQVWTGGDTWPH